MAYDPLDPDEFASGEPNKQELWQKLLDNQEDFDDRLNTPLSVDYQPIHFFAQGPLNIFDLEVGLDIQRLSFNIDILAGRVLTYTAGSGGSNEIDILFKRAAAAFVTIFSTKPTVTSGAGDFGIGTGSLSVTQLLAGDLIKMDITAVQSGSPRGLAGVLEYEAT